MSQFDLLEPTYTRIPAYPRSQLSLVLIQTQRFDRPLPHLAQQMGDPAEDQVSFEEHFRQGVVNSASTIKKKKKSGCTCKKTKCLKMYCECFSSGKLCTEDCNCLDCQNCQEHSDSILKAQEIVKVKEQNKAESKKGCTCKKSQCQKKYCQCFNLGLPCGKDCRCIGCENPHSNRQKSGTNQSRETIFCRIAESFIDC